MIYEFFLLKCVIFVVFLDVTFSCWKSLFRCCWKGRKVWKWVKCVIFEGLGWCLMWISIESWKYISSIILRKSAFWKWWKCLFFGLSRLPNEGFWISRRHLKALNLSFQEHIGFPSWDVHGIRDSHGFEGTDLIAHFDATFYCCKSWFRCCCKGRKVWKWVKCMMYEWLGGGRMCISFESIKMNSKIVKNGEIFHYLNKKKSRFVRNGMEIKWRNGWKQDERGSLTTFWNILKDGFNWGKSGVKFVEWKKMCAQVRTL